MRVVVNSLTISYILCALGQHIVYTIHNTALAADHQRNVCSHQGRGGPCVIKGVGVRGAGGVCLGGRGSCDH